MTMRQWLDAILTFIGSTSLTDSEYDSMNFLKVTNGTYDQASYDELAKILAGRELVTTMQVRLVGFYASKGFTVSPASTARSEIYIGSAL